MSALDQKINTHFPGLVVREDLVKTVKGNAIVPSYVLEYLLGQYCATSDEPSILSGIETVKAILTKHYVHRNEAGLVRSTIREKGRHKVIDRISVALNDKKDCYEAQFANLGIKKILVDSATVKAHPKLLVSGVWCIADVEYEHTEDKDASPWIMGSIKPIQLSHFDYESYLSSRSQFTTDEWIDLLIQSVGFNPEMFGKRSKLTQLIRLIPFCEHNYNLIELGPKGTGKSHIYSEFSPHGILLSGGEVSVPKLFVNNSSGKIGLVGYWDTVAFDEFSGKKKRADKALVDIMKNYMANKSFSRGVETLWGPKRPWRLLAIPDTPYPICLSIQTCLMNCLKLFMTPLFWTVFTSTFLAGKWILSGEKCSRPVMALWLIISLRFCAICVTTIIPTNTGISLHCHRLFPPVIAMELTRPSLA